MFSKRISQSDCSIQIKLNYYYIFHYVVSQVKYKYYEPFINSSIYYPYAIIPISEIQFFFNVAYTLYEDRQKDFSMLKTSMLCLLYVFLYTIRCITCISWNAKQNKISHCRNNSKIKYQNRRKRQNHYS